MISLNGYWFDGKTSSQVPAVLRVYDNGAVRVESGETAEELIKLPKFDIRLSPRLANTPRYLMFPGGEKFETVDNDTADEITRRFKPSALYAFLHRLETRKRYILLSLVFMILAALVFARFGVPLTAKAIAFRLPDSVKQMAGEQTLDMLDRGPFKPSELDDETVSRIVHHFQPVFEDHRPHHLKVLFRKGGKVGANAFALPGGTVVFTDEMVNLSENDDELMAVLAHESGHLVNHHGMRSVIQDSLFAFALIAVTGDASGTSEVFLAFPVFLAEMAYSRQFEGEADQYALDYMRSKNIDPAHFARLMRRIEKEDKTKREGGEDEWTNYLSTHPRLKERLENFAPEPGDSKER